MKRFGGKKNLWHCLCSLKLKNIIVLIEMQICVFKASIKEQNILVDALQLFANSATKNKSR